MRGLLNRTRLASAHPLADYIRANKLCERGRDYKGADVVTSSVVMAGEYVGEFAVVDYFKNADALGVSADGCASALAL